jgi:exodeoxyribonuclease-1
VAELRLCWYDLETTGTHPGLDRIAQVAWQLTDTELRPLAPPEQFLICPLPDELPVPEACLVSGLTPEQRRRAGIPEPEAAARLQTLLGAAPTLLIGYNNRRFDDGFLRHLMWRNLLDPYRHEWADGNRRLDLLDIVRLAHALRPEGLRWPRHDDGRVSLRLADLSAANGLSHERAHDAASDVGATLELARRLKTVHPRLWAYALGLTERARCERLLGTARREPILHVSPRYPLERAHLAPVLCLGPLAGQRHRHLLYDLRIDPDLFAGATAVELRERLYTPRDALPEEIARPPVKSVHVGHAPMLAPWSVAGPDVLQRAQIDPATVRRHGDRLLADAHLRRTLLECAAGEIEADPSLDPELALYSAFIGEADRRRLAALHTLDPTEWPARLADFDDPRLPPLIGRYLARHHPHTLALADHERWRAEVADRLRFGVQGRSLTIDQYQARIAELKVRHAAEPAALAVLDALEAWGRELRRRFGLDTLPVPPV